MKSNTLYEISSEFYDLSLFKFAGVFQVPEKLLSEITDCVLGAYANRISQISKIVIQESEEKRDAFLYITEKYKNEDEFIKNTLKDILFEFKSNIDFMEDTDISIDLVGEHKDYFPHDFSKFELKIVRKNKKIPFNKKIKMFDLIFDDVIYEVSFNEIIKILQDRLKDQIEIIKENVDIFKHTIIDHDNIKAYKNLIDFCNQFVYIETEYSNNKSAVYDFDLKNLIQDWKYLKKIPIDYDEIISVVIYFNRATAYRITNTDNFNGLWDQKNNSIIIITEVPDIINDPEKFLEQMEKNIVNFKMAIRHEIQHACQQILKEINESKNLMGLPSKKFKEKNIDIYGRNIKNFSIDPIIHPLRDIEFYPRLSDSIHSFNESKGKIKELWYDFAKYFTCIISGDEYDKARFKYFRKQDGSKDYGQKVSDQPNSHKDDFFFNLKQYQPEKWKKAVKEFFKELNL